jgi:hypothetical protein
MKRVRGRDENRPREEIKCTDSLRAKSPGHCHSPQYIQSVCTVQNATPFICFVIYIYIYMHVCIEHSSSRAVIVDSARRWRKSCQRSFSLFWHHPTFQFLNSQCTIFFLSSNLVRLACRSRQRRICIIAYASWTTVLVFVMATGTRNKCWRMRG